MRSREYNVCVDQYADGLYRFALRLVESEVLAQDVVQDAFVRLWEKRHEVDGAKAKSYLFTSVYHASVDVIRRRRPTEDVAACSESYETLNHDVREVLNRGMALLPEVQRTAIMLRDYEGYSYAEIGEIAHLSETQVKVYIHRARTFLRKYIGHPDDLL